ncbi:hypothetical protein EUGRSUZ_K02056 [Eucalyptus grandis]|uniref:Uncharacterized protein n=2 Tax=Eucalyptus grandis TaxID=71139 RepID=A0ACC3IWW3_EUCGR|nr:hypothetical protein EUGRSUZ_K02056 [Eucalyptus grandis]
MEQQPPTTAAAAATATATATAPPPPLPPPTSAESLPPPQTQTQTQTQPQPQPSSNSLPPPARAATSSASAESIPASQNPNPTPKPSIPPATPLQQSTPAPSSQPQASQPLPSPAQPKPPVLTRPWQQPPSSLTHFSSSSSPAAPAAAGPPQRGGIAIGVPAHHTSPPPQAAPFSSPLGQHFGGLGRGSVNVPDSIPNASASQVRPATPTGMGSIGSGSQMRPGGIHQQRPLQSSSAQGHGLLRGSAVGSPISHSSSTSQGMQSPNQPWLSSPSQGKPPLPSPSYRPQMNPQSLQQRTLMSQQHHPPLSTASQQQYTTPGPSQPAQSNQLQEQHGQQFPTSRAPQSLPHQQISRIQGSGAQKPSSLATMQAQPITAPMNGKIAGSGSDESCNRILSKRSIHELVNQIDPSEKLDPEVEDILVDIAEEFVESITAFGCSLAKHRKSTSLEAKDILLHLERNWNIALPGFSADEVKSYRKPVTNDIHKERLAVIKRSAVVSEVVNARNAPGQVASSAKGTLGKAAANVLGSPNLKS